MSNQTPADRPVKVLVLGLLLCTWSVVGFCLFTSRQVETSDSVKQAAPTLKVSQVSHPVKPARVSPNTLRLQELARKNKARNAAMTNSVKKAAVAPTTPETVATPEPTTTYEPVDATEPVASPEPVETQEPVTVTEPVTEPVEMQESIAVTEPVETQEPATATESVSVTEPVETPEPVAVTEPVVSPETVVAAEPKTVPEPPVTVPEPVAVPDPITVEKPATFPRWSMDPFDQTAADNTVATDESSDIPPPTEVFPEPSSGAEEPQAEELSDSAAKEPKAAFTATENKLVISHAAQGHGPAQVLLNGITYTVTPENPVELSSTVSDAWDFRFLINGRPGHFQLMLPAGNYIAANHSGNWVLMENPDSIGN